MKYKDMNKIETDKKSLSSYWMDDWSTPSLGTSFDTKSSVNLYKLAAGKRAVANFVSIVTNKTIPVKFKTRGNSYTDGKQVIISSNIESPKDFDIAVGLALHEGSHIVMSDFDILRQLRSLIPDSIVCKATDLGIYGTLGHIKDILNYIEDRRIDFSIYTNSPGYQGYYKAMYDYYFYHKIIDKGLMSREYRTETVDNYMFRIINLHNKNTDLTALKGLREIYRVIDLSNISRLETTMDALGVAIDVYEIMLSYLDDKSKSMFDDETDDSKGDSSDQNDESESDDETDGSSDNGDENESDEKTDGSSDQNDESESDDETESDDKGGSSDEADSDGETDGNGGDGSDDENQTDGAGVSMSGNGDGDETDTDESDESDLPELSSNQKRQLEKQIKKQKDFIDGDVTKKQVTKNEAKEIDQISVSGVSITQVGDEVAGLSGHNQKGIDVIVVKKMTRELMDMSSFPLSNSFWGLSSRSVEAVNEGIRIGKLLGKKLQTRGESRTTVFNRQKTGKLDKRLVSSLGYGSESVFQFTDVDTYKKANLHVSIDASGSMGGGKWNKTITNVVALCKAVDMIPNLQIQVSIRTTSDEAPWLPYVVLAYDSRVDKFSKVKQLFPLLNVSGTTPEGLCFEAIMNQLIPSEPDVDSYFLNISDGEPYYYNTEYQYMGTEAFNHTRKMVKLIQSRGIRVLSYFIAEYGCQVSPAFSKMYGTSACGIDLTNVSQITKTINKLFLEKSK